MSQTVDSVTLTSVWKQIT